MGAYDCIIKDKVTDYYDKKAKYYDVWNIHTIRLTYVDINFFEKVFIAHGINPRTVLDVGCGTGRLSLGLAKKGYVVTGVDVSSKSVEIAKNKVNGYPAKFVVSEISKYSPSERFDCAVSGDDVVGHFIFNSYAIRSMSAVFRCLNKGGIFIFDAANPDSKHRYPKLKKWSAKLRGIEIKAERRSTFHDDGIYEWSDKLKVHDNGKYNSMHLENRIKIRSPEEWTKILNKAGFSEVEHHPAILQGGIPRIFYYVAVKH